MLHLEYDSPEWGRTTWDLGEPGSVLLADGIQHVAYRLTRTSSMVPNSTFVDWHDARLKPVRVETWCIQFHEQDCTRKGVFWDREGFVSDLGLDIGYDLIHGIPMERRFMGVEVLLEPSVTLERGLIRVTFDADSFRGLREPPFTGFLLFRPGNIYPDRVSLDWDAVYDIDLTLVAVEVKPRADTITLDSMEFGFTSDLAATKPLFFVGEEVDTSQIGYGHAELLGAFLDDFPEAREALEGGCFAAYGFDPVERQGTLIDPVYEGPIAEFRVKIVGSDGRARFWDVGAAYYQPLGLVLTERNSSIDSSVEELCLMPGQAKAAAFSLPAFLDRAAGLVQTTGGFHQFIVALEPRASGLADAGGSRMTYSALFDEVPGTEQDFAKYYLVNLDAETRRFLRASLDPADVGSPD